MNLQIKNQKKAHEFIGLCLGLVADSKLVKKEVEYLRTWLRKHPEIAGTYPVKGLFIRICEILEDGVIDAQEEKELLIHLHEMTLIDNSVKIDHLKPTGALLIPAYTQPVPTIKFNGSHFYLYGKFIIGTTDWLQEQVTDKGGIVVDNLSEKTNYCIIGAMSELNATIPEEAAPILKQMALFSQQQLKLVSEENWVNHLFN